jgi:hypothetical protein
VFALLALFAALFLDADCNAFDRNAARGFFRAISIFRYFARYCGKITGGSF